MLRARRARTLRPSLSMVRLTAIALAVLLLAPAAASASGADVIRDCARNGRLTKRYSQKEYEQALANLPADIEEYGDCRNIIRDAQLGAAGGGGGGGGPAGAIPGIGAAAATPQTPQEKQALEQAASKGGDPVKVSSNGKPLVPGASSFSAGGLSHGLPTPVIIVLALLGAAALAGAVIALRPQIRRVLSRGKG
jgi:hypothetical protein